MYVKSLEELRNEVAILKDVYQDNFNETLTDEKIAEALNLILIQKQAEMLKNKFITYPVNSLITILQELNRKHEPEGIKQDEFPIQDQPVKKQKRTKK